MKKFLTVLPFVFFLSSALYAQTTRSNMCNLGSEHKDPAKFVSISEVDSIPSKFPDLESQYFLWYYYHQARSNNAPQRVLKELVWNIAAYYKGMKNPYTEDGFDYTTEYFGMRVNAILDELSEKKYVKVY